MNELELEADSCIIDSTDGRIICLTFFTVLKFDNLIDVIIRLVRLIEKSEEKQIDSLNIVLSDDAELARLNSIYRDTIGTTDVLTFNLTDKFSVSKLTNNNLPNLTGISGDIYISSDRVIAQSAERSVKPKDEFLHLLAHGLLHLCGWTHEDDLALSKIIQTGEKYIMMAYSGE